MLSLDPAAATADYCRRARRIRASFHRSPSLRQQALSQLASQRDAQMNVVSVRRLQPKVELTTTQTIEARFAEHAGIKLQPFGFTYSDRVELLNAAERLGINRFRANMILALHEHRAGTTRVSTAATSVAMVPSFALIFGIEILIVGLIAWACIY